MLRITFLVNLIWRWDDLRIKEDGQLHQAQEVVELACPVYGSMPQYLEDTLFPQWLNMHPRQNAMMKNEKTIS